MILSTRSMRFVRLEWGFRLATLRTHTKSMLVLLDIISQRGSLTRTDTKEKKNWGYPHFRAHV